MVARASRILIIEDEKHIAEGLKLNFELQGYEVEHAENGMLEDLIKMCKRRLGEDLIKIYMA